MRSLKAHLLSEQTGSWSQIGLMRVATFGLLLLFSDYFSPVSFANFARTGTCPESMGVWFDLPLSADLARNLHLGYKVTLGLAAVGLFTRLAQWLAFGLFFILQLNAYKYCITDHANLPAVVLLLFWCLFDRGSGWRLERLFFKGGSTTSDSAARELSLALKAYFCVIFFSAGYTKLRMSGLDWIFTDNLWRMLLLQNYFFESSGARGLFQGWNAFLLSHPMLCRLVAFDVVLIEILAPLALWRRSWAKWIVPHLFLMQIGIFVFFYIDFRVWLVLYLVWLNYEPLERQLNQLLPIASKFTIRPDHRSDGGSGNC